MPETIPALNLPKKKYHFLYWVSSKDEKLLSKIEFPVLILLIGLL